MSAAAPMARLRALLREAGSVLVTFSGGVDSALVALVAHQELGDKALSLTADSATFPPEELAEAKAIAAERGLRHRVVGSAELEREGYAANAGDRCYFCKTELFELARDVARDEGLRWVMDGTIVDDLGGHRPGLQASTEQQVRHPLVEAGFDKAAVRAAARELGLAIWDKPAFACLGSRFPVGTRVTPERLGRIQRVESLLRRFGLQGFRVRFHSLEGAEMVRIELPVEQLPLLTSEGLRDAVVETCRQEGFRYVTLDLAGYRMGNLSHRLGE